MICGSLGYGGKERIKELQELLRENGFEVIDQLKDMDYCEIQDFRDKLELCREIVRRDLEKVSEADVIIIISDFPSFGASVEAFQASMSGKRVIAYSEGKARSPWPLAMAQEVCESKEELLEALRREEMRKIGKIPNFFGEHEAEFVYEGFKCICPVTGLEDRAKITIRYIPERWLIEYESLDKYFRSFEKRAIHHEAVVEEIFRDVKEEISPRELEVKGEFEERSGVKAVIKKRWKR
jgi:7-cyano-7-deazaguanine reductase